MARQIYIVDAFIVDANGTFNHLDGYPKKFDSQKTLCQHGRGAEHERALAAADANVERSVPGLFPERIRSALLALI